MQTPADSRRLYRRRRIGVFGTLAVLLVAGAYALGMLLAPLPASAASAIAGHTLVGTAAQPSWPNGGSAAIGAVGYDTLLAQTGTTASIPIASMTKTITALVVLEAKPIASGSEGPTITFTDADVSIYHQVVQEGGSWAPVVAGERLTEKQTLQAMLLPSANNYAISLSNWAFGSTSAFLTAANAWIGKHGFTGTHLSDPAGFDPTTVSTASDLVGIGKLVLANPVLASVVKLKTVTLPGAGTQGNGNKLLGHDGIDGIKTGFTDEAGHCLMFSAKATVGSHTVTIVGVELGMPSYAALWATVPPLLDSVRNGFHSIALTGPKASFGTVTTQWGASSALVSTAPSSLLTWSNTPITVTTNTSHVSAARKGTQVGTVTFTLGKTVVTKPLVLAKTIRDPGFWWRVTHPFALFA